MRGTAISPIAIILKYARLSNFLEIEELPSVSSFHCLTSFSNSFCLGKAESGILEGKGFLLSSFEVIRISSFQKFIIV
jgi:hypothetical protein